MLSRRDKLLIQPWEERRFQDHRAKVECALPAIDARAPASRAHVAVKLKKWQREAERRRRVAEDNYSLLQRLQAIMRGKRLDNCWDTPLPKGLEALGQQRSGVKGKGVDGASTVLHRGRLLQQVCFYTILRKRCTSLVRRGEGSANGILRAFADSFRHKVGMFYSAEALRGRVAARALTAQPAEDSCAGNVKCYACCNKRKTMLQLNKVYGARTDSLPSI
ncbi:hypothetical protein MSG28_002558 [Choristoneura fumiferana]|uniref:Uncharacterized protein n=1 Tax=Choristoneura fumiferana TaxID=7141 RepID=A0ACC0JW84_CHOFU|nr:hypothetical protein MSG28_002558 [Choristoneura fumiferana]